MRSREIDRKFILSALILMGCMAYGCSSGSGKINVQISLQNSGALKITGPDTVILREIQRDSVPWQILFPVYRMPADTDMRDYQSVQPGKYRLDSSAVFFTPDTPFIAGKTYFLRWANFGNNKDPWSILKSRRKPGTNSYTDLTFKK